MAEHIFDIADTDRTVGVNARLTASQRSRSSTSSTASELRVVSETSELEIEILNPQAGDWHSRPLAWRSAKLETT